jgi:lysophospholipase L1-like esterase
MPRAGSAGFDTFCQMPGKKLLYNRTVQPSPGQTDITALAGQNPDRKFCQWVINFPLYGGVDSVEIGLKADSRIAPPKAHKVADPVLFYGSSITQGGCASRPGNVYTSMLCRAVDAPQINLGFSGSARGETAVAEAIASLKLSAFVMDYDHNAPDAEHLQATHEPFFKIIRKIQPDLPVIMLSKCDFGYIDQATIDAHSRRRDIIRQTYLNAVAAGDKNVYFVDGEKLFGTDLRDCCTVDGCHPNDLGFYRMYKCVLPVLKKVLK